MPEDQPRTNRPTLENLLQLKRTERPAEAFWHDWDARLREKQLAALIPVASPWARLASVMGRFAKIGVPVTAAMAVAVGVVVLNKDQWAGSDLISSSPGREEAIIAGAQGANVIESRSTETEGAVRTVMIEAAPSVAAAASDTGTSSRSADQLARTLPWLTNVSVKRESARVDIEAATSLRVENAPTALAVTAFEDSRRDNKPVWVPTEQNIREVVASEIGISPAYNDRANSGWMARVVAANPRSRYMESRIDSEDYPRELSRVGVTSSTLSFKF